MGRFTGKTAVVTGSGRRGGLGEAIVRRLASEGAAVVLSDLGASRDSATPDAMIGADAEMEALAAELRAETGSLISTFVCDVRDYDQVRRLADIGATDFCGAPFGSGGEIQASIDVLAGLVAS